MENNFTLKQEMYCCDLQMSGIEASKKLKEDQPYLCFSCMNNVVKTFSHLQEQIEQLKQENEKLQEEMMLLRDEQNEEKRIMGEEIRLLEEKLLSRKKD